MVIKVACFELGKFTENLFVSSFRVTDCWFPWNLLKWYLASHSLFFRSETDQVRTLQYIRGLIVGPFFVSAKLISLAVFVAYSLSGGVMSTDTVFVTLALYQAVRLATTLFVPFAITFISETKVTTKRLEVSSVLHGIIVCCYLNWVDHIFLCSERDFQRHICQSIPLCVHPY